MYLQLCSILGLILLRRSLAVVVLNSPNSPIPLLSLKTSAEIKSGLVRVSQTFVYQSAENKIEEIEYHFPLLENAVFDSFFAEVNGRLIGGTIKERCPEHADSFSEVDKSILEGFSEYNEIGEIMRLKLGQLQPYQKISITLAYLERLLVIMNHLMMFVVPAVPYRFSGKFLSPLSTAGRTDEDKDLEEPASPNMNGPKKNYTWELRATVFNSNALKVFRISSPSQHLSYNETERGIFVISLGNEKDKSEFRGFKILIHYYGIHSPAIHFERHPLHKDSVVGRISLVPYLSDWDTYELLNNKAERQDDYKRLFNLFKDSARGQYLFLLDYSSSMTEKKISIAKKCLKFLFRHIPPKITFNFISFAESHTAYFHESVPSSLENIWVAIASLTGVQPSSQKKNIYNVVRSLLSGQKGSKQRASEPLYIFLLSDGWTDEEDQVLSLVKTAKRTKIFPIGIGRGAAHSFLRRVAFLTNGVSIPATSSNEKAIERQLVHLYWKVISPFVCDITVKTSVDYLVVERVHSHSEDGFLNKEEEYEHYVFLNATRLLSEYSGKNITVSITFYNSHIDKTELYTMSTSINILTSGTVLHKLAYKMKINQMLLGLTEVEKTDLKHIIDEEILDISTRFQVLCEKSALLIAIPGGKKSHEKRTYYVSTLISDDFWEFYSSDNFTCTPRDQKCHDEKEMQKSRKAAPLIDELDQPPISKGFTEKRISLSLLGLSLLLLLAL